MPNVIKINDEITLDHILNIFKILWNYKYKIVSCLIGALVITWLLVRQINPVWEGRAIVQIGQVSDKPLEPVANVITRIGHSSFTDKIIQQLERQHIGTSKDYALFRESLKVKQVNENLIEIKVRAFAHDLPEKIIDSLLTQIKNFHDKISQEEVNFLKDEFSSSEQMVKQGKSLLSMLEKRMTATKMSGFDMAMSSAIIKLTLNYVKDLERMNLKYKKGLSLSKMCFTSLVDGVSTSTRPVYPNKVIYYILGSLLGFGIGLFYAFCDHSYKRFKHSVD